MDVPADPQPCTPDSVGACPHPCQALGPPPRAALATRSARHNPPACDGAPPGACACPTSRPVKTGPRSGRRPRIPLTAAGGVVGAARHCRRRYGGGHVLVCCGTPQGVPAGRRKRRPPRSPDLRRWRGAGRWRSPRSRPQGGAPRRMLRRRGGRASRRASVAGLPCVAAT